MTTNREFLEQLSDKKLTAYLLDNFYCGMCVFEDKECSKTQCFEGIVQWLNQESRE